MGFIDKFRAFHSKAVEYTYFWNTHGTFFRIDYMLGYKRSLNKLKKIVIISSIFSDHNTMKLEINHKKHPKKHRKTWKLNNKLLNNEYANKKIKEEIKKIPWNKWKWGHNKPKPVGHRENNPKRDIHSITGVSQKTRKSSNK